jgi:hypothetical protein
MYMESEKNHRETMMMNHVSLTEIVNPERLVTVGVTSAGTVEFVMPKWLLSIFKILQTSI